MRQPTVITRFAPSPSGYLHLGHAYSALVAADFAKRHGGTLLLRIEDIDTQRCKPEFTDAIIEDLTWLGIKWTGKIRVQSKHFKDYQAALDQLKIQGLAYPCFCSRKDIRDEIARSGSAPHGPDGFHYPGSCRTLSAREVEEKLAREEDHCWRLNVTAATALLTANKNWPLAWHDEQKGLQAVHADDLDDVVLDRKLSPSSYHIAVCVDDAAQNISDVVRGQDLFHATHTHRLLQALLGLPTPIYHHHPLMLDEKGNRFAKRDNAVTLRAMREGGMSAADVINLCNIP